MKCTECVHYKECRKKKDLRRVRSKCSPSRFERVQKVMTNVDHIRSMTDEELAEFIATTFENGRVSVFAIYPELTENHCGLDWLKQPYKEEV